MGQSFFGVGVVLFLAGGISKQPFVSHLGAILFVTSSVFWIYSKLALDDIWYERTLSQKWAFFGDTAELKITVRNKKPLPCWLKCLDEVPETLEFLDSPKEAIEPYHKYERSLLRNSIFLKGYERVTRTFPLQCKRRGVFQFGPLTLSSTDPMGLYKVASGNESCDVLTVFPRYVPLAEKSFQILSPFGDYHKTSWLYQDPNVYKGTRPYTPGDPLKHIHWKNLAKTGALETRTYESSFCPKIVLCLNLSTSQYIWEGINEEMFESLIVAASSLAETFSKKGVSLGLVSNAMTKWPSTDAWQIPDAGYSNRSFPVGIPPSIGGSQKAQSHLREILSCLSGIGYFAFEGFRNACRKPWVMAGDAFPIVITGIINEEVLGLLSDLNRSRARTGQRNPVVLFLLQAESSGVKGTKLRDEKELRFLKIARNLTWKVVSARLPGGWLLADRLEVEELR